MDDARPYGETNTAHIYRASEARPKKDRVMTTVHRLKVTLRSVKPPICGGSKLR
jgi:hypothetical protein